jgi:HEAT repeat protein
MGRRKEGETRRLISALLFFCTFLLLFFAFLTVNSFGQSRLDSYTKAIKSGSVEEKREALFQIRNLRSEEASRIALPALKDSSQIVRATAASSVIFLPKTEAATTLIPLLSDKADFVRREAAFALGQVGDSSAAAPLIQTLQKDKVFEVRTAAASALGKVGDPSAVEPLIKILQNKPSEADEFLRRAAARSLGQIAQVINTSRAKVMTPQNFLPDKYKNLDGTDFNALVSRFPVFRSAVDVLGKVLQNDGEADDTRREAAYSLGSIGGESALKPLRIYQNSADPYLAEACKEAIEKIQAGMAAAQTKTAQ